MKKSSSANRFWSSSGTALIARSEEEERADESDEGEHHEPRKPISARQVIEPTKPVREPAGSIAAELRRNTAGTDDRLGEPASDVRSRLVVRTVVAASGQREPEDRFQPL